MEIEKFYIDDEEVEQREFERQLQDAYTADFELNYASYFDECHEEVEVAGHLLKASEILSACDPTAYRCHMLDDADFTFKDYLYNVYRNVSWEEELNGKTFRYDWRDEEEESEEA